MDKMREDKSADVYLKYKYYKIVDFYVPDTGKNNGKLVIKLEELSVYEPEETDDEASLYSGYSVWEINKREIKDITKRMKRIVYFIFKI